MSFIYNVVLASGAQQSNSVMHIYIYISTFGITSSTDTSAQTPGNSEGRGSLECRSPWGRRVGHD